MKLQTLTASEMEKFKLLYPTTSKKELREIFKINSKNVFTRITKEAGFKVEHRSIDMPKKYEFNKNFFDNIDTEEKAYWLGFLMADGYITKDWVLALRVIDLDAIEKLKNSLQTNAEIKIIPGIGRQTSYEIRFCSIDMIKTLEKYGLVNNKTFRTKIPEQIPQALVPDFLRGYFDGDGCIYTRKNKDFQPNCTITSSSIKVLDQIQDFLKNKNILNKDKNYIKDYITYRILSLNNREENYAFLCLIYKNATIYLDRKYKKAINIINNKEKVFTDKRSPSKSKYRGVYKNWNRFSAKITYKKQIIHLGSFDTEIEAAKAYNAKLIELGMNPYNQNKFD